MNRQIHKTIKNPILKQIKQDTRPAKKLNLDELLTYIKTNVLKPVEIIPDIIEKTLIFDPESHLDSIFKDYDVKKYDIEEIYKSSDSFIYSLINCIKTDEIDLNDKNYLKSIKSFIYNNFNSCFFENNYKQLSKECHFDKDTIKKNLLNFELSRNEILVIADIFHINIFIADKSRDKLFFTGTNYVSFKKNIFLINDNNIYEPLIIDNKLYLEQTHEFIDYAKQAEFESYNEPLEVYIKSPEFRKDIKDKIIEKQFIKPEPKPELDEPETIAKNKAEVIKYTKKILSGLKMDELTELALENNIEIDSIINGKKKKKTKTVLIEELLSK